jgi:hypothetical protein
MSLSVGLVAALVVVLTPPQPRASPVQSPCAGQLNYQVCDGRQTVIVDAHLDAQPGRSGEQRSTGSAMERPGSHRLVRCGPGTAARLAASGDPTAAPDAAACAAEQQSCAAGLSQTGQKGVAVMRLEKGADGTWYFNGWACRVVGPPRVTPQMVIAQATRLGPAGAIGGAPNKNTLGNLQTVLWLVIGPVVQLPQVTILGRKVGITITFDHADWSFGDGHSDTTDVPGKPYRVAEHCTTITCPGHYGHTYTSTGAMTITAIASWRVRFRVGNGAPTSIPGTVTGPASQTTIRVLEARGVLVPDPTPS